MAAIEDVKMRVSVEGMRQLDELKKKVDGAKTSVNNLSTAILGVGFATFISSALQAADRIADFSDATNISIASLKGLEAAMNAAGGNGKNLEKSINTLYAAIETANGGSLAMRDAFAKVGVSLDDLRNKSETDILQTTLEGLAKMPPGAERAAVSTMLLSRSMRSVDPKALLEALDPQKYAESEEATRKAAEAQQKLEESYKALQEGAIKALEPILNLLGEKKLSVEAATKLVQALGIAFAVVFGAQAIASVAGMITALANFNKALAITAGLSNLLGKTPLGLILKMGAATAAGAGIALAIDELISKNEELTASANQAGAAQAAVTGSTPGVAPTGRIQQARPQTGAAGRSQELDARQRAVLDSQRRIEASRIELMKLAQIQGANEITKINVETEAEIARARVEIFAKENLTKEQKEAEFAAKRAQLQKQAENQIFDIRKRANDETNKIINASRIETDRAAALQGASEIEKIQANLAADLAAQRLEIYSKENFTRAELDSQYAAKKLELEKRAETEIARIRADNQRTLSDQTRGYMDQISQLLGYEKTELQKINDIIAQQPEKYKEIGDQMRANAAQQDKNLQYIKEFNKEQERQKSLLTEGAGQGADFATSMLELIHQHNAALKMLDATSASERTRIQETLNMEMKMAGFIRSRITDKVTEAQIADQANDATAEQIQLLIDTSEAIALQRQNEKSLLSIRLQQAEQLRELTSGFDYAWRDAFDKYRENALDTAGQTREAFNNFTQGAEDAFVRFAQTGKLSFKDMANSIIADLARIAFKRAVLAIFGVPGRAEGGPVDANNPYIVGEKGPELFIPKSAGTIVPNDKLGTTGSGQPIGQTVVNYNINAVDAASFRALVARDPSFIYSVTEQGRRSTPSRSR